MVKITCYGGVGEIGGNKILIEDKDTRVFLDFGMSFGKHSMFFEEYLKPRASNGMVDLLITGLLPELKGLYRADLLEMAGLEVHKEPEFDAILLSHPHADHANYISFIDERIPTYAGEAAVLVLNAVQEAGSRDLEKEILNYKKRPMLKKDYRQTPVERKFNKFRTGHKLKIGNLEIHPIHLDHSVPGSYGFIIYASDAIIAYTGDLRMHGPRADMTEEFILKSKDAKPDVLISEGTRVGHDSDMNESKVRARCSHVLSKTKGLTMADFSFKDTDRFKTFYSIAKEQGKKLSISTKDAVMLNYLSKDPKLGLPKLNDSNIVIFKQKAASGTYADEDYATWEKDIFTASGITIQTARDIKAKENDFVFVGGFFSINDLIDIRPSEGSSYIYSHSEPFNEEMEIDSKRLNNWISLFKLEMHRESYHCSGHANWSDLKSMIRQIAPKSLIPIHTEKPDAFSEVSSNLCIPRYGEVLTL